MWMTEIRHLVLLDRWPAAALIEETNRPPESLADVIEIRQQGPPCGAG